MIEAAKGSLSSGAAACGGVTLGDSASWGRRAGGTAPRQDAEGAEPPQQSLGSSFHDLSGSGGQVAAHGFQQAVEVDVGVAQVDMAEDIR